MKYLLHNEFYKILFIFVSLVNTCLASGYSSADISQDDEIFEKDDTLKKEFSVLQVKFNEIVKTSGDKDQVDTNYNELIPIYARLDNISHWATKMKIQNTKTEFLLDKVYSLAVKLTAQSNDQTKSIKSFLERTKDYKCIDLFIAIPAPTQKAIRQLKPVVVTSESTLRVASAPTKEAISVKTITGY